MGSTNVRVSIPNVDYTRHTRNVLAVIAEVKEDLYKYYHSWSIILLNLFLQILDTKNGFSKHTYTRTKINPCKANLKLDLFTVFKPVDQKEN